MFELTTIGPRVASRMCRRNAATCAPNAGDIGHFRAFPTVDSPTIRSTSRRRDPDTTRWSSSLPTRSAPTRRTLHETRTLCAHHRRARRRPRHRRRDRARIGVDARGLGELHLARREPQRLRHRTRRGRGHRGAHRHSGRRRGQPHRLRLQGGLRLLEARLALVAGEQPLLRLDLVPVHRREPEAHRGAGQARRDRDRRRHRGRSGQPDAEHRHGRDRRRGPGRRRRLRRDVRPGLRPRQVHRAGLQGHRHVVRRRGRRRLGRHLAGLCARRLERQGGHRHRLRQRRRDGHEPGARREPHQRDVRRGRLHRRHGDRLHRVGRERHREAHVHVPRGLRRPHRRRAHRPGPG